MKGIGFIRGVATAGHVLCNIGKVFAAIASAFLLFLILTCSFMPGNMIEVHTVTSSEMKMNVKSLLSAEQWDQFKEDYREIVAGITDQEVSLTENGIRSEIASQEEVLTNRGLAVMLVPAFAEATLLCALLHFAAKAFRALRESEIPFPLTAVEPIRWSAFLTVALQAVPYFCGLLLSLITGTESTSSASLSLSGIFAGVLLLALAELFQIGNGLFLRVSEKRGEEGVPPSKPL